MRVPCGSTAQEIAVSPRLKITLVIRLRHRETYLKKNGPGGLDRDRIAGEPVLGDLSQAT